VIRPRLLLLLLAVVVLTACGRDTANDPLPPPWPEENAPERLRLLADDLQLYLAETGKMPTTLTVMDDVHLSAGGPYAKARFAYHASGIAFLRDGWRLVAVDDRRNAPGKIWCVVRPPVRVANAPRFRVVLITLAELRETAEEK
jgi:hypothetical protein